MVWGKGADGDWSESEWDEELPFVGTNLPPDSTFDAKVNQKTVTIQVPQEAYSLTVGGGEVAVAAGQSFTLVTDLTVDGGKFSLATGAGLSAASIQLLNTGTLSGNSTVNIPTTVTAGVVEAPGAGEIVMIAAPGFLDEDVEDDGLTQA